MTVLPPCGHLISWRRHKKITTVFEILKAFINRGWADPAMLKVLTRCLSSCVGHFYHFAFWWPDRVPNRPNKKTACQVRFTGSIVHGGYRGHRSRHKNYAAPGHPFGRCTPRNPVRVTLTRALPANLILCNVVKTANVACSSECRGSSTHACA